MLLKQKPSKHFVNGLLGFITLGIYTPLEARVYCSQ
ncbi:Bor/Iss family lipoprotein [Staphylococcus aureus]